MQAKFRGLAEKAGDRCVVYADQSTFALQMIDYAHHEAHQGKHYNLSYSVASVGGLTTPDDMMTLTFKTPDSDILLHLVIAAICSSGARFRFIEGGTGGGATPTGTLTPFNSRRGSSNISIITDLSDVANKVSYDATLVTGGDSLVDEYIGADGLGNSFVSGLARSEQEWILAPATQYQLSLFEADAVPGTIQMAWYEHEDKVAVD